MSYDIIGDIAIIKQPLSKPLEEYVKFILEHNKYIKTILFQKTDVKPPYRIPEYEVVWGEKKTETVHKEFGLIFKLDVIRCYYSPRLSSERMRIAKKVKENEEVLVMFSGVNPYSIYIAKFSNPKIVYSIEINPYAVRYGIENVKLNKVEDKIITILGDVRDVCPLISFLEDKDAVIKYDENYIDQIIDAGLELNKVIVKVERDFDLDKIKEIKASKYYILTNDPSILLGKIYQIDGWIKDIGSSFLIFESKNNEVFEIKKFNKKFDRIIMPLPKEADTFLDVAIPLIKNNGIIHLYQFFKEDEIETKSKEILEKYSKELGFNYEILEIKKCGDIAPRTYRVCIDFKVIK